MSQTWASLPGLNLQNITTENPFLWTSTSDKENATRHLEPLNTTVAMEQDYVFMAVQLTAVMVPIFFSFIFLVGVTGNILVITVMMKIYRPQSQGLNSTNRFILNLAISDLFFLFFCVPFQGVIYSMDDWPFGSFMCVFCEFCQKVAMLASVYTLVALSLDRYFAVAFATSAKQIRTRKNSMYCLVAIWVISVGLGIPSIWTRQHFYYEGIPLCIPNLNMLALNRVYVVLICVIGYVVPLLLIFCCYVGVLRTMSRNARSAAVAGSKSAQNSRKRVTKIVIMVVILFAIDWFLHHLTTIWIQFWKFTFTEATFVLKVLAHCLSYANSCVNPIIYAFVSNRFRNDFKKVFTCQYISDAFGSVKLYSRRVAASIRHPKHATVANGREIIETNGNTAGQKLHPRTPVVIQFPSERSNSKRHNERANGSRSSYSFKKGRKDAAEQEEEKKLLNSSFSVTHDGPSMTDQTSSCDKFSKAGVLPDDKRHVKVKIENNIPLSQISVDSTDSGFNTTPTHMSSKNKYFSTSFEEKPHVFSGDQTSDFTIEVDTKYPFKVKKPKKKRKKTYRLNMVDEESSNMF